MALRFSNEADEKLIDLVEAREYLYSVSHKNYKNQQLRTIAWNEIGEQIEKLVSLLSSFLNKSSYRIPAYTIPLYLFHWNIIHVTMP